MILVVLLYALFASVFTISKTALAVTEPFFLIGSRMLVAGIILVAYLLLIKKETIKINKQDWFQIILLAVLNIYMTNALEFWGLRYLTSFKTCFIYSLSPFASALISYFVFTEKMNFKKWMGLAIGFSGFLPIFFHHTQIEEQAGTFWAFSWAELSVVGAALTSVWGWIILKQLVSHRNLSFILVNGLSMIIGGLIALFHSALTETWEPLPVSDYAIFGLTAIALIIISNLICYNLYGSLLRRFSATFMSFAGFTTPLFTALFGWFFLGETIAPPFYLSAAIVFAGLTLFYHEELVLKQEVSI